MTSPSITEADTATNKTAPEQPKASFDVWLRWSDVLATRLETVKQVYVDHGVETEVPRISTYLSRLRFVLDGALAQHLAHQPYAALKQMDQGQEKFTEMQIQALAGIFRALLVDFPKISSDMQKNLDSRWEGQCNGRVASDLFRGPIGTLNEGIGSGHPRDGQLPGVLEQLMHLEEGGSARTPRQTTLSPEEQQRWQETARRWATVNSKHLRGAGRMD